MLKDVKVDKKKKEEFVFSLQDLELDHIMGRNYEGGWPVWAKILLKPIMIFAMAEAIFWLSMTWIFVRIFPVNPDFKKDLRRWPSALFFFSTGTACKYVKTHSMTWRALEYLYSWTDSTKRLTGFDWFVCNLWNQLENVRATRNRLRNVKSVMHFEILELLQRGGNIHIASLAAGSARAPIEVIADICRKFDISPERFKLLLIDTDPEAFIFAKSLAKNLYDGLELRIDTLQYHISSDPEKLKDLTAAVREFEPSIIEMVGFTDYMSPEKAVSVFSALRNVLPTWGLLVTNNVTPNDEQSFLELVVVWRMKNRTEDEMRNIFRDAKFDNVFVVWEPTGIQPIYVLRK